MGTFAVITIAAVIAAGAQHAPSRDAGGSVTVGALDPASAVLSEALSAARAAESDGRYPEAVRMYKTQAAAGSGLAAKRLGDLYTRGFPGVERDQAQGLRWYREAEVRGEVLAQALRLR
jgi:TPR repeat protein